MTTATIRRTTKLAQPRKTAMPYIIIYLDYIAPETKLLPCKANKDMTITGENGAIVHLRAGEAFDLVRSDSVENGWYIVRHVSGEKRCSCPATKPCIHEKAVAMRMATRRGRIEILVAGRTAQIVTKPVPKPCSVTIEARMEHMPLNGNRGFSLMRR
jgi:hypothetical protein